jgi:hypothetical protein
MAASGSLFAGKPRSGSVRASGNQIDADGNEVEVLFSYNIFILPNV